MGQQNFKSRRVTPDRASSEHQRPRRSSPDVPANQSKTAPTTVTTPTAATARPDALTRGPVRRIVAARVGDRPWKAWLIAGGWLLAVWFALWGAVTPMLALTGIGVAVATLALFPLPVVEFSFGLHPVRALILIGRFLTDVILASVQVAWLAIRPRPPQSEITTVQLRSTSDLIQTLTSMAVSLVPGSLIIEADPDHRTLTIHVLDPGPSGMRQFHQRVLDQEERIVRALGGVLEINAVMGTGEPDERAVHVGQIAWGPAGQTHKAADAAGDPDADEQSDVVAMDADLMQAAPNEVDR